jgi:hypothetical protein
MEKKAGLAEKALKKKNEEDERSRELQRSLATQRLLATTSSSSSSSSSVLRGPQPLSFRPSPSSARARLSLLSRTRARKQSSPGPLPSAAAVQQLAVPPKPSHKKVSPRPKLPPDFNAMSSSNNHHGSGGGGRSSNSRGGGGGRSRNAMGKQRAKKKRRVEPSAPTNGAASTSDGSKHGSTVARDDSDETDDEDDMDGVDVRDGSSVPAVPPSPPPPAFADALRRDEALAGIERLPLFHRSPTATRADALGSARTSFVETPLRLAERNKLELLAVLQRTIEAADGHVRGGTTDGGDNMRRCCEDIRRLTGYVDVAFTSCPAAGEETVLIRALCNLYEHTLADGDATLSGAFIARFGSATGLNLTLTNTTITCQRHGDPATGAEACGSAAGCQDPKGSDLQMCRLIKEIHFHCLRAAGAKIIGVILCGNASAATVGLNTKTSQRFEELDHSLLDLAAQKTYEGLLLFHVPHTKYISPLRILNKSVALTLKSDPADPLGVSSTCMAGWAAIGSLLAPHVTEETIYNNCSQRCDPSSPVVVKTFENRRSSEVTAMELAHLKAARSQTATAQMKGRLIGNWFENDYRTDAAEYARLTRLPQPLQPIDAQHRTDLEIKYAGFGTGTAGLLKFHKYQE